MFYEIGIYYPDKAHDAQVKIQNIPVPVQSRRFWLAGMPIPHWNEDETNTWVKVPVLNGMTKIYVDYSTKKDLSNIDDVMMFGDDFKYNKNWQNGSGVTHQIINQQMYVDSTNASATEAGAIYLGSPFSSFVETKLLINPQVVITNARYGIATHINPSTLGAASNDHKWASILIYDTDTTRSSYYLANLQEFVAWHQWISYSWQINAWYYIKQKINGLTVQSKVWKLGEEEPDWMMTTTYSSDNEDQPYIGIYTAKGCKSYSKFIYAYQPLPTDPVIKYIRPVTHLNWYFGKR